YLEENVHQTYVDVGVMARELQERYREYNRRKAVPFRLLVEQAYKTVLHSYGLDSNPSSENEDDANSDLEVMEDGAGGGANANHMNDALTNMYMSNKNKPSGGAAGSGAGDGEAIDISSDEDDEGADSRDKDKAVSTTSNSMRLIESKHTIDNAVRPAEQLPASQAKRRRLDQPQISEVSNSSNPLLPQPTPRPPPASNRGAGAGRTDSSAPTAAPRTKRFKKEVCARFVETTFEDVGGMDKILRDLCELLLHVKHPEVYRHVGLPPPRGFLLHGPPGSGKTLLAHAIAGQLKIGLIEIPATELVAGVSGESEERIREVFEQAAVLSPCVLFIDEIDAISANRVNAQKDMERRIVAQLLSSLDNLPKLEGGDGVLVIGATNRPDALDPALRRVGRFDQEISLGIPDREARAQILKIICKNLKIEENIDFDELAKLTPGYVGADLLALATRAATTAIKSKRMAELEASRRKQEQEALNKKDDDDEKDEDAAKEAVESEKKPDDEAKVEESKATDGDVEMVADSSTSGDKIEQEVPKSTTEGVESVAAESSEAEKKDDEPMETEKDKEEVTVEEPEQTVPEPTVVEESDETPADEERPPTPVLTLEKMMNLLLDHSNPLPDDELETLCIERADFLESLKSVQPSAKREGFITVPDVTWNDIGSLGDIREELKLAILAPVKFPQRLKLLGLSSPSGVLLCGPPGCGKTLLAKAVANEAGINFISVKGPELLNMYVGESERAVRQCFQRARNSTPCVIFFDEFDSLCPKRSDSSEGSAGMRVVNQLLTEMDGIEDRKGVFLMAATNRPDIVDPAVLRPGRLDKILYVGLPAEEDRVDILRALTKNRTQPPLADDVDLSVVARLTEGYTGADLAGLVRQASLQTLKDSIAECSSDDNVSNESEQDLKVAMVHFQEAIRSIKPSVNEEDKKHYERLKRKYGTQSVDQ
ncbi:AAEL000081-PA, partial [Aedes aegypti]